MDESNQRQLGLGGCNTTPAMIVRNIFAMIVKERFVIIAKRHFAANAALYSTASVERHHV